MSIFCCRSSNDYILKHQIHSGRTEGLQLVLDGHMDKVTSGSVSDSFSGFSVVVDEQQNFPFTARNGIILKSGLENEVTISLTRFDADKKIKEKVSSQKRKCYFPDEYPMKIHHNYSYANCLFECKLKFAQLKMVEQNKKSCVPWFFPSQDEFLLNICDPWETKNFQSIFKNVNDEECTHCLPDCISTHYKTSLTSAPLGYCDETNLGLSPLCDLSVNKELMLNPPIWKATVDAEYEKFDGGQLPSFIRNPTNLLNNIRQYATDKEGTNLAFRAQYESNKEYDALQNDITLVNFYFDQSDVVQYLTYLRMTPMDFISKVNNLTE